VPVCNIEMGYMSNEEEDRLLVTEAYQQKIVDGLTEGFIRYFTD
jgi:N-acetylmuramoyl-L-alanine amidase